MEVLVRFMINRKRNWLKLILNTPSRGIIINDEYVKIEVKDIFLERTQNHLLKYSVRHDTTLIHDLLFDSYDPKKGITYNLSFKPHSKYEKYISELNGGYAGIWYCDSSESQYQKSISFKKQISKALEQFPAEANCSVHLCFESYDGQEVEKYTIDRSITDLFDFNIRGVNLNGIYLNIIRFLLPPNKLWECEEDSYIIENIKNKDGKIFKESKLLCIFE